MIIRLLILGTAALFAQPVGQLAGVVRDATGAVLPGASVTVAGATLPGTRTVVTNERGRYEFGDLPSGRYGVSAALGGFETQTADLNLASGAATLDFVLGVSSRSETVTVTATKIGVTDIQSTPIAITALSSRTLDHLGVETTEGLVGVVPSVTMSQQPGSAQVTIRGIGTNSTVVGADPSATVHLDGVYLGRPAMVLMDFLNIERVEVLRGPQGTLYGRNSVGGTINIVTRQPSNSLESSLRLGAGNYQKLRAEGVVSGPLMKDKVMGSFAFLRGMRDGFVKDLDHQDHPLGSEDATAGRAQVRVVFGRRNELLLSGDYSRLDNVPLFYSKPLVAKAGFVFNNPPSFWDVRASDLATGKNIQQGASAKLVVGLTAATTLTSLTAYRTSNYRFFLDADATELPLQTSNVPDIQRQASQELTLVHQGSKFTWIGGAFFLRDHDEGQVEITVYSRRSQVRPFAKVGVNAWALFGQATYNVSSRVSLTGGIRYTDEQKDLDNTGGVYTLGTALLQDPTSFYQYVDRATFHAWTPKGGIQAQLSRDTYVYASATRGFKSGGFNPTARLPGLAYNPEFAWSYEGGVKRTMAGGRARANTAIFFNDYRDLQVQSFPAPGVVDVTNAGSATIKGIEFEATATAVRGVQLAGYVSWLDAAYDRYLALVPGSSTRRDAVGNRLNNAPEWSGGGSAAYEFPIGRLWTAFARADASWQSRVFFTPFNDDIQTQRSYGLAHLRGGFEPKSRRWEIAIYIRNVSNQEYITGSADVPLPAFAGRQGDPRRWGTQFTIHK